MIVFVLILSIIIIAVVIAGVIWFAFYRRHSTQSRKATKETAEAGGLSFRWNYIILPVAILLLSIFSSAYFYHLLPPQVAYHFKLDGTPDRWFGRGMAMVLVLMLQIFFTLLAGATTWGITKLSIFSRQTGSAQIKPERILLLMGNMIALPQLIVCFAMLDIFSYNAFKIHLMPLWLFALIIMALGVIILGRFFIRAYKQAGAATKE